MNQTQTEVIAGRVERGGSFHESSMSSCLAQGEDQPHLLMGLGNTASLAPPGL